MSENEGGPVQFYEAEPGCFLPVGVTMEEHQLAMAGNYSPGEDEYHHQTFGDIGHQFDAARLELAAATLIERDARRVWRTGDGEDIPLSRLGKHHLIHICGFLVGMGLDPQEVAPNLAAVAKRRWEPKRATRRGR